MRRVRQTGLGQTIRQFFGGVCTTLILGAGAAVKQATGQAYSQRQPNKSLWTTCPQDMVYVIDRSGSMGTTDFYPSRLDGAKQALRAHLNKRMEINPDDRVALVAFTQEADIYCPLTNITEACDLLKELDKLQPWDGTDIAAGLEKAKEIFEPLINTENLLQRLRRIQLLTDGESPDPTAVASELKDQMGVLLEVVGVGGNRMAVDEDLLRRVATTDEDGFTHYWFIKNTQSLVRHYEGLATGLVWKERQS